MKLTQTQLSATQYFAEEHTKTQIYLHHTAGSPDPFGTFGWWSANPERVATCVSVGGKPKIGIYSVLYGDILFWNIDIKKSKVIDFLDYIIKI